MRNLTKLVVKLDSTDWGVKILEKVKLKSEYMKLQYLLKIVGIIDSGGQAKNFLADSVVLVNHQRETRRGRKLRKGDLITVGKSNFKIIAADEIK